MGEVERARAVLGRARDDGSQVGRSKMGLDILGREKNFMSLHLYRHTAAMTAAGAASDGRPNFSGGGSVSLLELLHAPAQGGEHAARVGD